MKGGIEEGDFPGRAFDAIEPDGIARLGVPAGTKDGCEEQSGGEKALQHARAPAVRDEAASVAGER